MHAISFARFIFGGDGAFQNFIFFSLNPIAIRRT
jgi:hypothetical protein